MSFLDSSPDKETKIELIKTLQAVSEGKVIYMICVQPFTLNEPCWNARKTDQNIAEKFVGDGTGIVSNSKVHSYGKEHSLYVICIPILLEGFGTR